MAQYSKSSENKVHSATNPMPTKRNEDQHVQFEDNRPEAEMHKKVQTMVNQSPRVAQMKAVQAITDRYAQSLPSRRQASAGEPLTQPSVVQKQVVQLKITDKELETLQASLGAKLKAAIATAKSGGALAFEKYIESCAKDKKIDSTNETNAKDLLKMAWALNLVSGDIIGFIAGKGTDDGDAILGAFLRTVTDATGTNRQAWGGGQHAEYVSSPESLRFWLTYPITFLNQQFAGMAEDEKLNMLKDKDGWSSEKGPTGLAMDLLAPDKYKTEARKPQTLTLDALRKTFMDEYRWDLKSDSKLEAGQQLWDRKGKLWKIISLTATHVTITPEEYVEPPEEAAPEEVTEEEAVTEES